MDIHTMLEVKAMYEDEDVNFSKWLKQTIEQLELVQDERYKEHQRRQTESL